MSCSLPTMLIFTILAFVNFVLVSSSLPTYDVRSLSKERLFFTDADSLSQEESTRLLDEDRDTRFIGDVIVGERTADETIFRRTVEISNPTDRVYSTTISLSVANGVIHYMSVLNEPGSYAVACSDPYSLGTSKSRFNIRVLPNSQSTLTLVVAAH